MRLRLARVWAQLRAGAPLLQRLPRARKVRRGSLRLWYRVLGRRLLVEPSAGRHFRRPGRRRAGPAGEGPTASLLCPNNAPIVASRSSCPRRRPPCSPSRRRPRASSCTTSPWRSPRGRRSPEGCRWTTAATTASRSSSRPSGPGTARRAAGAQLRSPGTCSWLFSRGYYTVRHLNIPFSCA